MFTVNIFIVGVCYITYITSTNGLPSTTTEHVNSNTTLSLPQQKLSPENKTISDLFTQQTEAIKKIVAEHKPLSLDYPIVTKHDAEVKTTEILKEQEIEEQNRKLKLKQEKERQSVEELKLRCQHFFKIQEQKAKSEELEKISETTSIPAVEAFGPPVKPEFLKHVLKVTTFPPLQQSEETTPSQVKTGNYFIFTDILPNTHKTTTEVPKTSPVSASYEVRPQSSDFYQSSQNYIASNPQYNTNTYGIKSTQPQLYHTYQSQPVQYVKYEPVIFQKTLLSNGQNYYYWYRAMPRYPYAQNIVTNQDNFDTYSNSNDLVTTPLTTQPTEKQTTQQLTTTTSRPKTTTTTPAPTTTKQTTTTTMRTTELLPQYEIIYKTTQKPNIMLKKASIVIDQQNTEITKPSKLVEEEMNKDQQNKYRSELRFVLPMAFSSYSDSTSHYPWQLDPFAYYPKHLQPSVMNIQVPYVPTFHMIRTLSVPYDEDEEVYQKESEDGR